MSEDRSRILNMLAEGKITAEEAERLLDALDPRTGGGTSTGGSQRSRATPARCSRRCRSTSTSRSLR